jgi:4-hydroxy-tetrahydrodipicolinate reductase
MIKVLVNGALGRMGSQTVKAVDAADDMELVAIVDRRLDQDTPFCPEGCSAAGFSDVTAAIVATSPDVMVDFTTPSTVEENLRAVLPLGVHCVVGTTGLSEAKLEELVCLAPSGTALFVAPNFTTGAVLMMQFSRLAARYFPDVEVIELHHDGKADAPSGTALRTAQLISIARDEPSHAPGRETELPGYEGARGALVDGVPVHSVRTAGHVASQEVIFGSLGQTLTLRHDSFDRASYMPGVLLAIRKAPSYPGLTIGLENLMSLS